MAKVQNDSIAIYKDYIEAKSDPKKTVTKVAKKYGITRSALYQIVRRVEKGETSKIEQCTERSRLECLWKYKYHARYLAIPKDQKPASVAALRKLIKEMHVDKFNVSQIAKRIGKDRATVLYHVELKTK